MFSLTKEERLSDKKTISTLFEQGHSFHVEPFKVIWMNVDNSVHQGIASIMVTVSRAVSFNAVERNRIRRLVKEAYRKNKISLLDFLTKNNKRCAFIIMFKGKDIPSYKETEEKIILILQRLQEKYEKTVK